MVTPSTLTRNWAAEVQKWLGSERCKALVMQPGPGAESQVGSIHARTQHASSDAQSHRLFCINVHIACFANSSDRCNTLVMHPDPGAESWIDFPCMHVRCMLCAGTHVTSLLICTVLTVLQCLDGDTLHKPAWEDSTWLTHTHLAHVLDCNLPA